MAHEIYADAVTGRAAFAYAKEDGPGWWEGDNGLAGTPLADSFCGVKDACAAASLLWHPYEERLYCQDTAGAYSVPLEKKAIRRADTGGVLGVASMTYETVPHALHYQAAALPLLAAGARWSSIGAVRGGSRYFASFQVGASTIAGDEHRHIVSVIGGYDQMTPVVFTTSTVRVVCNNTLTAALADSAGNLRFAHHRNANVRLVDASAVLGSAHASIGKLGAALEALASKSVSTADVRRVLEKLYPSTKVAKAKVKADDVMIEGAEGASLIDQILSQPNGGASDVGRASLDALVADASEMQELLAAKPGDGRVLRSILEAYETAPGARPGTGYGLVQAITYVETHERGRSMGDRYVRRLTDTERDVNLIDVVLAELHVQRAA